MTILREATAFDSVAHGDVACVAEESKKENLDARERYTMKPYEARLAIIDMRICRARIRTVLTTFYHMNHHVATGHVVKFFIVV